MPIGELLAPVSDEAPGGQDLYDDPERQTIEQAFEEDPSSVDWREVVGMIEAQSQRTKDVWLAIYLARAGARMGRLDVVVMGCEMLAGLLETYWDVLHPSLEEYGFQGRKGPCESLTRIGTFLGPLKRIVLVEHPRLGSYAAEDLERFEAEGDTADGFGMFRHAVGETPGEALEEAMASLRAMRGAIGRADAVLMARAEDDTGTDFKPTYQAIDNMIRWLAPYAGSAEAEAAPEGDDATAAPSHDVQRGSGRIESREDVARAIDAIAEYYARREPASPIPVALRRVRGWINMDFLAILRDIAPGGMVEAGAVLLARPEEESSEY
ncbi:ImpA family type VI secretion system protein [Sphingomonas sp. S2-65]|uniref:type VI secretion system protein TssA n=1 Tax=Sphingomonas sp. S2-65 TaxID=2903960 RepID=UPI001F3EDA29|nr:type VI secretion system ImpA family N-terminal domain-containing protein [Sphingomonas sp. S2-65]UYY60297.1 type VI secretion system ImpA family N-terminal domain-containing protein [Sphingomonas sp. S2-65]